MSIKNVSIIGLGALGIMYAHHMSKTIPYENLHIIADQNRINRYTKDKLYCNGQACNFNYMTPESPSAPADLLIFTVKYTQLTEAIVAVRNHIGPKTIILSALNGVVSEKEIGDVYGHDHNLYCVAQAMDALKEGNQMSFRSMGILCFGELDSEVNTEKVSAVADFFDEIHLPYEINNRMNLKLWSKLMVNVGVNQTVAVLEGTTRIVQEDPKARQMMVEAMEEVRLVANAEGIGLREEDVTYWLKVVDNLNPDGMPSMRQDLKAKRYSEVEIFSGTIIRLAQKHRLSVPVNEMFYKRITEIEGSYAT